MNEILITISTIHTYLTRYFRIKWILECNFDLLLHENVKDFPDHKMTDLLGQVC